LEDCFFSALLPDDRSRDHPRWRVSLHGEIHQDEEAALTREALQGMKALVLEPHGGRSSSMTRDASEWRSTACLKSI
jgi:hypothetical protein